MITCGKCHYESEIEEEFLIIQGNIGIPSDVKNDIGFGGIIGQNIYSMKKLYEMQQNRHAKGFGIKFDFDSPYTVDLEGGFVFSNVYCRECIREILNSETILKAIRVKKKLKAI